MTRNPKILFIGFGELGKTGCLRAFNLTRCLRQLGWDAQLAVPQSPANRQCQEAELVGPIYFDSNPTRIRSSIGKIFREVQPEFVHMLNPREKAVLLAIAFPKVRFVFDWEDWTTFIEKRPTLRWYKRARDRWLLKRASLVVCASRWLADYIREQYRHSALYLPYACLPRVFPRTHDGAVPPLAVGMGSLHPDWDHDLLIEAAGVLKQRGIEHPIRWVGAGAQLEACRERASQLGLKQFEFPGYLDWDSMLAELTSAHCLVFPIRNKPLNLARCPFKCYQFAQSGRPVITSDVGEVRSILGDHALYVEPTAEAIADALHRIMSSPRRPDVPYDLSEQIWEQRAATLSERLLMMRS
ncbi:MAG: glycosyltransferase family 4 protein [Planctomycetota bacterium]